METILTSSPITSEDSDKSYEDFYQDSCFCLHDNSIISHQNILLDSLDHNYVSDSTLSLQNSLLESWSVSYNDNFLTCVESNAVPDFSIINQNIFLDTHENNTLYDSSKDSFLYDSNLHSPPSSTSPVISTDSYLETFKENFATPSVIDHQNILFNSSDPTQTNSHYFN